MIYRIGISALCGLSMAALLVSCLTGGGGSGSVLPTRPRAVAPRSEQQRTGFQTQTLWDPMVHLRSDVAICYGINGSLPDRISQWKGQGYATYAMTGASWGDYEDYLYGRFDGFVHVDEAQQDRDGLALLHHGKQPYLSPSDGYGKFLCQLARRAISAGAEAIVLEEPEYWAHAGYSDGFKREWDDYFHESWSSPESSPDTQQRASRLKRDLNRRLLKQVFDFVKSENARDQKHFKCYVATHSLINYAHWRIVGPGSNLDEVGADGYIAQVWTGTARTPNVYRGRIRERVFETAFLEYGTMANLGRDAGAEVWFLSDPVEDAPDRSWGDYRASWESTLVASLFWPAVWRFEVMPWPERVFHGEYLVVDRSPIGPGGSSARQPIPTAYATELMTVITALGDMEQKEVAWGCGTRGIGVVVSDTMMFQRGEPSPSDPHLSSFYGLALPLIKHGIPVEPVQLENLTALDVLNSHRVLLMTYEGMKPMVPEVHDVLADWVRRGGALIFLGDDTDPYNRVRAWWNDSARGMNYESPREHLFEQLGLSGGTGPGIYKFGKGYISFDTSSPAALAQRPTGADHVRWLTARACGGIGMEFRETNYLTLRRGPYIVAAGLDESLVGDPVILRGHFIDLFDARLPVLTSVVLGPGARHLLLDLERARPQSPKVLASACKILKAETGPDGSFRFYADGPNLMEIIVRIALPKAPLRIDLDSDPLPETVWSWDPDTKTLLLHFPNWTGGSWVTVR